MATFLRGTTGYANEAEALGLFLAFWVCKYSIAWHVHSAGVGAFLHTGLGFYK